MYYPPRLMSFAFAFTSRPATSFSWFTSPFKSLRYVLWRRFKWYIISFLVIFCLLALVVLFFYSMPVRGSQWLLECLFLVFVVFSCFCCVHVFTGDLLPVGIGCALLLQYAGTWVAMVVGMFVSCYCFVSLLSLLLGVGGAIKKV